MQGFVTLSNTGRGPSYPAGAKSSRHYCVTAGKPEPVQAVRVGPAETARITGIFSDEAPAP